jgi:hypothetical protein
VAAPEIGFTGNEENVVDTFKLTLKEMMGFTNFNLFEGVFWIGCAMAALSLTRFAIAPARFWRLLAADLALFGVSDFVEAYLPVSFLDPGGEWLYTWKAACVIVFCGLAVWYFIFRTKK